MAGAQWTGGAYAGAKAAKARIRHNDKEERLKAKHSNEEIDKDKTPGNWSVRGLTYEQKCAFYDRRIDEVTEGVRMSSGKNANNTMQSVCVYEPQAPDGTRLDIEQLHVFYAQVWEIAKRQFGEDNLIEMDVHVDELHNYYDKAKGGKVESRIHGHLAMIPAVDFTVRTERVPVLGKDGKPVQLTDKDDNPQFYAKDDPSGQGRWKKGDPKLKTKKVVTKEPLPDGEWRLNHNEFASRTAIVAFNQAIDEMCQEKFGMDYMTGEGKHASRSVERMKGESRIAEAEAEVAEAEQQASASRVRASVDANLAEDMRREAETIEIEIESKREDLDLLDGDIAERRVILDGDDEYLGLDEEIAEKRKELAGLQSQIDQAEARGYADGYASGEDAVKKAEHRAVATQQRLDREITATQDARKAYEAAAGSVEGLSMDEVVKATFEVAEEMTAPKMRASMTGGKAEQEKPSILHQAVQKVVQWFGSLNVNGQPMAEVIAQRVRQRLLQRQKLVKDNAKVRDFERIEAEQGKANPDEDMTL